MVAQLLQLRLAFLANAFRRSSWTVASFIISFLYGIGAAVLAMVVFSGLRLAGVEIASGVTTALGSIIVLGFIVLPLVFGVDDALDPRRFALFPISATQLSIGLGVAALVSIPALVIGVVAAAQVVTWSRGALPAAIAVIGALLIIATCILASRVSAALAAWLLHTSRARDASSIVAVVFLLALAPIAIWIAGIDWQREGFAVLDSVARVASWTPLGAAWAAPGDAAEGQLGAAAVKLLIAAGFVALLAFAWRYLVQWMLITHTRARAPKLHRGLGWFTAFPATPSGVIAARTLSYWGRDARYRASLMMIPVIPLGVMIPLAIAGVPWDYLALFPLPLIALFLGWSLHNDVAYDSTSVWLHVAADVRGTADRLGRALPALLVGIPLVLLGAPLVAEFVGDPRVMWSVIGVSLGILLGALGVSSIFSARFPYPTVRPGDSPTTQPQSMGTSASLIQGFAFVLSLGFAAPAIMFTVWGLMVGGNWHWFALASGVGVGLLVFGVGVLWGGAIFAKRKIDLLAFTMRN